MFTYNVDFLLEKKTVDLTLRLIYFIRTLRIKLTALNFIFKKIAQCIFLPKKRHCDHWWVLSLRGYKRCHTSGFVLAVAFFSPKANMLYFMYRSIAVAWQLSLPIDDLQDNILDVLLNVHSVLCKLSTIN